MTQELNRGTAMNEETDHRDENIGQMLKRLRGDTSLRGVQRLSGISNAYLSQIEKGERHPGPKLLRRLAALYGVGVHELLRKAGYLDREERRGRSLRWTRRPRWRGPTSTSWPIPCSAWGRGPGVRSPSIRSDS